MTDADKSPVEKGLCLFFGCWNDAGHYLFARDGRRSGLPIQEDHRLSNELDGQFAPKRAQDGSVIWGDFRDSKQDWARYRKHSGAEEFPEGHFLRHRLRGYTLIQWWDRNQGDTRSGCNSTILLEGDRSTPELLAALGEYFPHVFANLKRNGIELVEVTL